MEIPFFKDLKAPLRREKFSLVRDRPSPDELAIDSDWKILIPPDSPPQISIAAKDLKEFLRDGGGIRVPILESDPNQTNLKKVICLRLKTSSSKRGKPESYQIKCSSQDILIEGFDESGVMYGVFYLEELMRFRKAPFIKIQTVKRNPLFETRILRSPMAFYYQEELLRINEAYPDNYLLKLAHHGFNGIWLRGILRELVKTEVFPELGRNSEKLLEQLNRLIERCGKFGIKVYLYFTEPLAFRKDSEFFRKYPHLKGEPSPTEPTCALCTSNQEVKEYLREGMKNLFKNAPGLEGVILITASEHHTHCYSHIDLKNSLGENFPSTISCPKCKQRTPQEVVAEIISLVVHSGVKAAASQTKVIAWNWSWSMYEEDPQAGIIKRLPEDVIIMADFERGGKTIIDGLQNVVDEYSLTYVGPSERFKGTAHISRSSGHKIYAKLQIGVTHEIATVPYFPVLHKIAKKFLNLKKTKATGLMGCWNFGNILSHNTELANWFSWAPLPKSINEILTKIAIRDFGEEKAKNFVKAWRHFSKASDHYPFAMKLVYWGPMNFGPAYPLFFKKVNIHMPTPWLLPKEIKYNMMNEKCMERTEYGDILDDFCQPFGPERVIKSFKLLCKEWEKGVNLIKEALPFVPKRLKEKAEKEYIVAAAILSQFKSTINFTEFTYLRDRLYKAKDDRKKKNILRKLISIANDEIQNSLFCKKLARKENTLGFHGEAFGYMYTPEKIDQKVKMVRDIIKKEIPEYIKKTLRSKS